MKCQIEGCDKKSRSLKMCTMHYTRQKRYGTVERLTGHPSPITIDGDVAYIELFGGRRAIIDTVDVDNVKDRKWCWTKPNGVISNVWKGTGIKLHRLLTNAPDGLVVDHINGDRLDNRKSNLRVVEQWKNVVNRKSSPMRNIEGKEGGFCVRLAANKVRYYIGYYHNLADAMVARDEAAKRIHGDLRAR